MTIVSRAYNKLKNTLGRFFLNKVLCFVDCDKDVFVKQVFPVQATLNAEALSNIKLPNDFMAFAGERLKNGNELIYCCDEGTLIAYGWRKRNMDRFFVYEIAGEIVFDQPVDILYDFMVLPQYRNKGIYKSMLRFLLSTRTSGVHSAIYADSVNAASLKAIRACGFREVCRVNHFSRNCTLK